MCGVGGAGVGVGGGGGNWEVYGTIMSRLLCICKNY